MPYAVGWNSTSRSRRHGRLYRIAERQDRTRVPWATILRSGRRKPGGMHHACYEVLDIPVARDILRNKACASWATENRKSAPSGVGGSRTRKIFPASRRNRGGQGRPMGLLGITVHRVIWWLLLMVLPGAQSVGFHDDVARGRRLRRATTPSLLKRSVTTAGFRPSLARRLLIIESGLIGFRPRA